MFRVLPTTSPQQFCSRAVEFVVEKIQAAQRDHGTYTIGLSGGSTPRKVYEELGIQNSKFKIKNVRLFLVDERYVPKDHPESNQRLVRETLLKNLPIPEENLVFPNTTIPIDACIEDYIRRLKELWKDRLPDLVILGMGTDGHIASLFPPLSDLALGDERLILHTQAPEGMGSPLARNRISLFLNALYAADEQVLLLRGEEKRKTWEEMMASSDDERWWPLKRVIKTGKLTVFAEW